ncbi:hypothetical protein BH09PSE1_BH09PSE1_02180 [soil metagenome]
MGEVMESERPGGPGDRILFWPQVQGIAGVSRSTIWRMQRAGDFPVAVQISRGRVGWWESELTAWKLARAPRRLPESRPFMPSADPSPVHVDPSGPRVRTPRKPVRAVAAALPEQEPSGPPRRTRRSATSPDQIAFDFES